MKIIDIEEVCKVAKRSNIKVLVDNTFCTSYLQTPLGLGADFVLYSTTKYYSDHLDIIGGALTLDNEEYFYRLKNIQSIGDAIPSPFDLAIVSRN